jgi:phytoene dehydrogenase-like protein
MKSKLKDIGIVLVTLALVLALVVSGCGPSETEETLAQTQAKLAETEETLVETQAKLAETEEALAALEENTKQHIVEFKIREYDAIVIGAGYGGMISAAILAKSGMKAVVVEPGDQVGGRTGSIDHDGYWVDYGLKDSRDASDIIMVMNPPQLYGQQAAEAAGAEVEMVEVGQIRGHIYPTGEVANLDVHDMESISNYFMQMVGVPPEKMNDFLFILADFMAIDPQEYRSVLVEDWLRENVADEEMHTYVYRYLVQLYAPPPEKASVGRIAEFFNLPGSTFRANDPEVGGNQGFIEPYARVVREYGGEIMLGQMPIEILVEDGKVQGVTIADKAGNVQELHAPVVIFNWVVWYVLDLVEESLLPEDLVENARALEQNYNVDTVLVNMGLSRLPTVRATGKPDDWGGWQRAVMGEDRVYGGGWLICSLATPTAAPPGKHLITFLYCTGGNLDESNPPFSSFAEARDKITSTAITCARDYYSDLDEITEWVSFTYHKGPSEVGWFFSPVERATVECPTIEGLYFVGSTTEVAGSYQDLEAHAALIATEMILNQR